MARKQAPGSSGSPRVKAFLLGFRWLALLLGLILMWFNAGTRFVPTPGLLKDLGLAVVLLLLVYHAGASVFLLKLADSSASILVLIGADLFSGAFLTFFYGPDYFMVGCLLPIIQTAYSFGGSWASVVAIVGACFFGPLLGNQLIQILGGRGPDVRIADLVTLRVEMVAAYAVVGLVLAWVVSAIRGDERDAESLRKNHVDEKRILLEELASTKKDFQELFNELAKRETALGKMQEESSEDREELETTLKKLHECRHQYQAAQQLAQRKEAHLATTHKRELEELRKEMDDAQRGMERTTTLLDTLVLVNGSLHRDQTVMNMIESLMKLVPSQTCLLYSVEMQDGQTELFPDGGASPYLEYLRNYSIKIGEGAIGWVAKRREPIRIDKEQAVVEGEEVSTLFSYEKSAIVAPLDFDGRLLGVVYMGRAAASSFSQEDFDMVVQFARLASSVFNNALTYQRTLSVGIFDDITGLYNALYFDERLTEEVKRAKRYNFALSLILLDIDHFTRFNEQYGHAEGNQVLKDVASILREHTRETDVLARLENDEFACLLVESEKSNAILIGERIRMALEMRYLGRSPGRRMHMTVSGGVTSFPAEASSREQLVEKAAEALERARKKDGNQLQY